MAERKAMTQHQSKTTAQQAKEDVESVLEILLRLAHHLVVARGEKVLKALHEGFGLTASHVFRELGDGEPALVSHPGRVERQQVLDEALLHLAVWEAQRKGVELTVVAFQREVTTLVGQYVLY